MNNKEHAKEYLTKRNYEMEILHDDGVNRTLKFMHEKSHNGYFMITTWPGHLAISGDMGTYVFSRINDMIDFFSGDGVNPGYWAEKVMAESKFGDGVSAFEADYFITETKKYLTEYFTDAGTLDEESEEYFDQLDMIGDEYEAIAWVRGIDLDGLEPSDIWVRDQYTFHYLFACYAINFACNAYLSGKEEKAA
ncbi:hypothetical protein [Dasania marina]|uniref:hypothetical protein n=1 Tax=Dasania marina TaxID=471499 RepID=UPI0003796A57|nr:hypothetical protein [Dasania marina]